MADAGARRAGTAPDRAGSARRSRPLVFVAVADRRSGSSLVTAFAMPRLHHAAAGSGARRLPRQCRQRSAWRCSSRCATPPPASSSPSSSRCCSRRSSSPRRLTTRAVLPIVIGLRTAPVLAIAPILIMVFGRGIGTAIVVVVIVSFFPIMVNAMRGFTATPKSALELMHVLGAGWFVDLHQGPPAVLAAVHLRRAAKRGDQRHALGDAGRMALRRRRASAR